MKNVALFFIVTIFYFGHVFAQGTTPNTITDSELIDYLFSKAKNISGITAYPRDEVPIMYIVSKETLNKEVCPQDPDNCRDLAAVFDDIGYRILIRDDFEIGDNFISYNYSFLIHELVHSLQYRQNGAEIFKNCDALFNTEDEAYTVQDKYLAKEGDFHRLEPSFRRFFHCEESDIHEDYIKSKLVWDQRNSTGHWKP